MSDEPNNEQQTADPLLSAYDEQQLALEDALQRRRTRVQLEETEKHAEAKKAQDMGSWTDEQLRRYTRRLAGYDAI
jgi:hypothetical protein